MSKPAPVCWRNLSIGLVILIGYAVIVPTRFGSRAAAPSMVERLRQIAKDVQFFPGHPMNTSELNELQEQLRDVKDASRQIDLRMRLGNLLLLHGKNEEAIEYLNIESWASKQGILPPQEVLHEANSLLAIAYLRLGEQENCVWSHTGDSCLFPILSPGVHKLRRGSQTAIEFLKKLLLENSNDLGSRWLLNLAYMTLGEYPEKVPKQWLIPSKVFEPEYTIPKFTDQAPTLGLDVIGLAGGSIMEDFDGDGYLDVMASSWGFNDQLRYFHNNHDGTFKDATLEAGLGGQLGGFNICQADYDNNGYPDVLVMRGAWLHEFGDLPISLLRNRGDGTFEDVTEAAGLLSFHPTQTAAWADFDNDGWLDVFIGNESDPTETHPCELFHNNGDGTFSNVATVLGVAAVGFVKGVAWGDYDNDGFPDLYVSRMGQPNLLYLNQGVNKRVKAAIHGKPVMLPGFVEVGEHAGVTEPLKSFATWFFDYDNDGWLDLFVAGFSVKPKFEGSLDDVVKMYLGLPHNGEYPRLYRNLGDGSFRDVTKDVRLDRVLLTMGANFGDLDNDGFPDIYLGTGEPDLRTQIPNRMFRNSGGSFFQDVTTSADLGHLQKGHAISFGDIDNDGDQDIYEVLGGWYAGDVSNNALFINQGNGNHWITLDLEGTKSNRSAIGARIKVVVDEPDGIRQVCATVSTGGSFGSSSLRQEIGLGQAKRIRRIEINWPVTGTQVLNDIALDQHLRIRESSSKYAILRFKRIDLLGRKNDHDHR